MTGTHIRNLLNFRCADAMQDIASAHWNAMAGDIPFLRHEFLLALEQSGCVTPESGWLPQHIVATDRTGVVGAMPFYIKGHSWGEYVFDWAWADAYQRHGFQYYPKALCAIPFTPAPSVKILVKRGADASAVRKGIIACALDTAQELRLSSVHCLFLTGEERREWLDQGFVARHGFQFHWQNKPYSDFGHYLDAFTADKRKKIRQQRKSVARSGVRIVIREGPDLDDDDWSAFYGFYLNTIHNHGAIDYLNLDFFTRLGRNLPGGVLQIQAQVKGKTIAAALFLKSRTTLYGRYWGCSRPVKNLHFELCYYQAIEYCIANRMQRFEAGAQGEHKLARGLLPTPTHSVHWLRHPEFFRAVSDHIQHESVHNERYMDILGQHSPFRRQ